MSVYGPDDVAFLLVDGYSLLGFTTELADSKEAITDPTHTFGDTWHEHTPVGVSRGELSQAGFFDDEAAGIHAALVEQGGTSRIVTYGVESNTVGKRSISFAGAFSAKYTRIAKLDALHRANVEYRVSGAVDEGRILHALGARTSDGNSEGADSVDNSASSAGGGVAYLHVVAYSGFTDVVFKVRHSADDVTYADLVTFATVTGTTAERATTAVTVNRHLAVDWNVTGSGSVTFMVGFKRNA
jgi:hypothetical protein